MTEQLADAAYLGAIILFILALGGLSNQETARRGRPATRREGQDRQAGEEHHGKQARLGEFEIRQEGRGRVLLDAPGAAL